MKHPVTGPRVYAILLIFSAGFISSKFFRKPEGREKSDRISAAESALGASLDDLSQATESSKLESGVPSVSAASNIHQAAGQHKRPLPSWVAKDSELDELISASSASPTRTPEEIQLEPLVTWTLNPSWSVAKPVVGARQTTKLHQDLRVEFASTAGKDDPEVVEPREIDAPVSPPSIRKPTIAPYRYSPWEADAAYQRSAEHWSEVGSSSTSLWAQPEKSTPIHWPDQQLNPTQLNRVHSRRTAPASNLPGAAHAQAPPSSKVVGATLQTPKQHAPPPLKAESPVQRRFLFQPGIRGSE